MVGRSMCRRSDLEGCNDIWGDGQTSEARSGKQDTYHKHAQAFQPWSHALHHQAHKGIQLVPALANFSITGRIFLKLSINNVVIIELPVWMYLNCFFLPD